MANLRTTGGVSSSRSFTEPQKYCTVCKYPLPPKALFCPGCGPPCLPDEDPEDGLSFGQATLRIALICLLFFIVVVYKFDVDLTRYLPNVFSTAPPPPDTKLTEDVKIVYQVAVPQANVRESKSTSSKVVLILDKGMNVVVLRKDDKWWQIQVGDRVGWISSKLLIAKAE